MAKLKMFCVFDSKIGEYMQPFFATHSGEALRGWEQLVNDGKSNLFQYPEDFSLFEIGTFDTEKAVFQSLNTPHSLATAISYKRKPKPEEPFLNS